jgi:hypothetical protein
MSLLSLVEPLHIISGPGIVLANSTTPTNLMPADATQRLRAGWFRFVGQHMSLFASGVASRGSGTLQFVLRLNGVNIFTGAVMTLASQTNVPWILRLQGTTRVISSLSSMFWMGTFSSALVVGSPAPTVGGNGCLPQPAVNPAVGATFDCSINQDFGLFAVWSAALPTNSIQMHQMVLESKL